MPKTVKKKNRCWPGYEPVPGKKAHSQGSCRPKPKSRLTKSASKLRSARERQLQRWAKAHPGSPRKAAQHLRRPKQAAGAEKDPPPSEVRERCGPTGQARPGA
jgi:hypothetical protein